MIHRNSEPSAVKCPALRPLYDLYFAFRLVLFFSFSYSPGMKESLYLTALMPMSMVIKYILHVVVVNVVDKTKRNIQKEAQIQLSAAMIPLFVRLLVHQYS